MIPEAIGALLMEFILGVLTALPLPDIEVPTFGPMVGLARSMDAFFPISEVLDYILTLIRVVIVLLGVKVVVYVYGLIPLKAA